MSPISKSLIAVGAALILFGLGYHFVGDKFSLGKLPGDFSVERENFRFYFPMTTSLLMSGVLSLIFYIVRKWCE